MEPRQTAATGQVPSPGPTESAGRQLMASSHASFERIEQKLSEFFRPCRSPPSSYTDLELQRISELLKNMDRPTWASIPRIYTVLRVISQLEHLDVFIQQGITDIWFPFSTSSLPGQMSPSMCTKFLDYQSIVLTKWVNLEKGIDLRHAHFGEDETLPFEVICSLGKGGFGSVDKVVSMLSGREFARKRFRRKGLRSRSDVASFKTELMVLKRLRHQHCVELIGSYTDSKNFGLIMSPVADCNLLEFYVLTTQSPDKTSLMRGFFGCLANALLYLHESKIRHRDIKPTNILVKGNTVYITDFGISHDFGALTKSTTTADTAKTMLYAAPEVVDVRPRNTKADIWSLGCVFLEMATVLKGARIRDLREYFNERTENRCFWANAEATTEWILNLHEMNPREDNAILGWITEMLNLDASLRPTAKLLFDGIVSYEPSLDEPVSFCGSCCREEQFSESEDSADEAWEQEESTAITSPATTQFSKSQPTYRKQYEATEIRDTVVEDAAVTVRRLTETIASQNTISNTNPWAKHLPRARSKYELVDHSNESPDHGSIPASSPINQGRPVPSTQPAATPSQIWEDFFASLDAASSGPHQQLDRERSTSGPPTNPWQPFQPSVQTSQYQRDATPFNLQSSTIPNQDITLNPNSHPAPTLNHHFPPFVQKDVEAFTPIELPNESRLFEMPAEIPHTLLNEFHRVHPNLGNVDLKKRSWGIDPPRLSYGHWASPATLLHAIKTEMQFMKALSLNHPEDFTFITNSSPKDLPKILGCMILSGFVVTASNYGFQSPLLLTAAYQPPNLSVQITHILLMHGASPLIKTSRGKTPLMAAVKEGNVASVDLLLRYGSPIAPQDDYGENALDKALIGGYESISSILLDYGAIPRQGLRIPPRLITPKIQDHLIQGYKVQLSPTKVTPIPDPTLVSPPAHVLAAAPPPALAPALAEPVRQAVELPTTTPERNDPIARPPGPPPYVSPRPTKHIDFEHMPVVYTPPLPLLTARDWTGPSYFLEAVICHQSLMDLVKAENDVLSNDLISTPVGNIAPDSLAAVARILMRGGLNINLLLRAGQTGPTPLQYVLEWGPEYSEMFNVMVRHGAIINQAGADGSTVLTLACSKGNLWAIRYLIDSGIKVDEQTGPRSISPLLCAVEFGQLGAVSLLISKGASIEVRDSKGRSPLLLAAQFGHPSIVRVLLDRGAIVSTRSFAGTTALKHAALSGNLEIVSLLLDAGAKLDERSAQDGDTALLAVAQKGLMEMAVFLISNKADVNIPHLSDGSTPLSAAASAGHVEMVKLLLSHGADVDTRGRIAKKTDNKEIASLLREAKKGKSGANKGSSGVNFAWFRG